MSTAAKTESFTDLCNERAPGKTWGEVAELTNTSPRTIWRLRHGLLPNPTRVTMQSIADGFSVGIERVEAAAKHSRDLAKRRRGPARV